ncbi:MAG: hypothetical protein GXO77_01795, partial [Calditrichaeota bacterium]|nr:hypothetical protein [Calditrichota bacterium]
MKELVIFTGAASSYYHFKNELIESVKRGHPDFLAILPVNRAVRKLKRELIDQARGQVLTDPPVFTFDRLLLEIYQSLPSARRLISADMFMVLISDILEKNAAQFEYLLPAKQMNEGLVKKVSDILSELRSFGFDSRRFARLELEDRKRHPQKYNDFAVLLTLLENKLGSGLIDEPFARAQAAENVTENLFKELFPKVQKVFISGYGLFSPPMFEFIDRVRNWAPVFIKLDYMPENPVLFNHTLNALQRFQTMNAQIRQIEKKSPLALHLFNRSNPPRTLLDGKERIRIVGLQEREQEVAFIAGKIRRLRRQGIALHRMAVTFSHLEKYVPLIRKVFREYGIPFNLSTGFELVQSPLIADFLAVLQIIELDFPLEKTLALFGCHFIQTDGELNLKLLRRLCCKARITSLNRRNLQRLRQFAQEAITDGEEDPEIDREAALEQIGFVERILTPFFDFPRQGTALELRRSYLELLKRLGLLSWYQSENPHLSERQRENNFRAYNQFVKVFERTIWTLQLIYSDETISRNQLLSYLQAAMERELYNLTEFPDFGVQIMPRLEILAVDFDVLFIGGLIDGDFPRSAVKDIFFGDSIRMEMGLPVSEELLDQDRFLFYQLLDSPAKRIFITFPRYRDEEALVPSSFLSDLQEISSVDLPQIDPQDVIFFTRQKLWEGLGSNIKLLTVAENRAAAAQNLRTLSALIPDAQNTLSGLIRRIRFASLRLMGNSFSVFEGNLSGDESVVGELQKRFERAVWSVSRLETYAFCPMKFFFSYLLRVEQPPVPEEEITPQERGLLAHRILFRFYTELKRQGLEKEPWEKPDLLHQIAQEEFDGFRRRGLFWELEKLRFFGNEQVNGLLNAFLEQERDRLSGSPFKPGYFELSFGFSGDFPRDIHSRKE